MNFLVRPTHLPSSTHRRRKHRGYLLIDIMIGGAMAAVIIAGVLTVLANARAKNVAAARDVVASQLVLEKLEQQRSLGFAGVAAATEPTVAGVTGAFKREVTVSAIGTDTVVSGTHTSTLRFRDVTVTVTYKVGELLQRGGGTRTSQATTRVYE